MEAGPEQVGRLRDRLKEETASAILAAAEATIGEAGLHGARIELIAAHAGVSVGTIYNHFKDRTALVQALFDSRGGRLREMLQSALEAAQGHPLRVQVRALLWATVEHGLAHRRLFAALLHENHGPARIRPPEVTRAALAVRSAAVIERASAAGELREDPQGVFSEALVALARQAFANAVDGRGNEAEVDALTELFVRGVAR